MKKTRLFSAISLLILSICVMAVGIYAANESDKSMGFGGTINIPANLIDVTVLGYIGDVTTGTKKYDSTTSADKTWTLVAGDLVFQSEDANDVASVKELTLTFVITNNSDFTLQAYFQENDTTKTTSYLGGTESDPIIKVAFGADDNIEATNGTTTITIVFDLQKLLDQEASYGFNYTLVIAEKK